VRIDEAHPHDLVGAVEGEGAAASA
jgi:hypothetical protein